MVIRNTRCEYCLALCPGCNRHEYNYLARWLFAVNPSSLSICNTTFNPVLLLYICGKTSCPVYAHITAISISDTVMPGNTSTCSDCMPCCFKAECIWELAADITIPWTWMIPSSQTNEVSQRYPCCWNDSRCCRMSIILTSAISLHAKMNRCANCETLEEVNRHRRP